MVALQEEDQPSFTTLKQRLEAATSASLLEHCRRSALPFLPYSEGYLRYSAQPLILPIRSVHALFDATQKVCALYNELCEILLQKPALIDEYFGLSQTQHLLWYASAGEWHGIARADVFFRKDGSVVVAEVNSDTPSAMDEAYLMSSYAAHHWQEFHNLNQNLQHYFIQSIRAAYSQLSQPIEQQPVIAIIFPTDIPEDMGLITLYKRWLENEGFSVLCGSPANIASDGNGRATLFEQPFDVMLRHYKTDWWCERLTVWKDSRAVPDSQPLVQALQHCIVAQSLGKLAVLNPWGSVVTQNKKSYAFFHEHNDLFSADAQANIQRYIPQTWRFTAISTDALIQEQKRWVLKSDYGCEGAEVVVGNNVNIDEWRKTIEMIVPDHWIVQEYFHAEQDENGIIDNYGVYILGGHACGLYVRSSKHLTNNRSIVSPVVGRSILAEAHAIQRNPISDSLWHAATPELLALLKVYTPSQDWLPFLMPLIFYSGNFSSIHTMAGNTVTPSNEMNAAYTVGKKLAAYLCHCKAEYVLETLIISDMPGVLSVAFCAGLASIAEPIVQIDNIQHEREVVPLRYTTEALSFYADKFACFNPWVSSSDQTELKKRTAVIVLDSERMPGTKLVTAEHYNNCHWAHIPDAFALKERGIKRILYIHPESVIFESDDLNEDFVVLAEAGLLFHYTHLNKLCDYLQEATDFAKTEIDSLLQEWVHQPQRRETLFSYLLKQDVGGVEGGLEANRDEEIGSAMIQTC